jgi:hypothetical protein
MSVDAHTNFAYSTVATAPSPAISGTTLTVASGAGAKFPAAPFNCTVWPVGAQPIYTTVDTTTAEIIRVTSKGSGDNWTISRNQEDGNTTNRTIIIGDQIAATITKKTLTDAETKLGVSTGGNTGGSTGVLYGPSFVLVGSNNITLSQSTDANSNITVTIQDSIETATMWFPYNEAVNVAGVHSNQSLQITPVPTPQRAGGVVGIDRLALPMYFTNTSNVTGTATVSFWYGLYTKTASSISLWGSTSRSESISYSGNDASSLSKRGIRLFTIGWTTTIPDDRYYVGIVSRTATAGGAATMSQILLSQLNSNYSGLLNAATTATAQWPLGFGYYSATTAGIPSSIAFSQIQGSGSMAARAPSWFAISGTV